jgi:uncharacterized membrane protein YeiH
MEMLGVAAFAFSGAEVAIRRRMDVFGVIMLGATTAFGGGILRDGLILNVTPVSLSQPWYWAIAVVVCLLVCWQRRPIPMLLWTFLDAVGLGAFVVGIGARLFAQHYPMGVFLLGSLLTAIGGGMLRDLMAQRIPVILRRDIYALAGLAGALLLYAMLRVQFNVILSMSLSLCLIVGIRMVSTIYQLNMPVPGDALTDVTDNTLSFAPVESTKDKKA